MNFTGMMMAKKFGLRTEILVQLTLLVGAALLLGGFLLLRFAERELLDQRAIGLAAVTETVARAQAAAGDLARTRALLQAVVAAAPLEGWALVDRNLTLLDGTMEPEPGELGKVRFSPDPALRIHYPPQFFLRSAEPSYLLVTVPLLAEREFNGGLQTRFSLEDVRRRVLSAQRLIFLYAFMYGIILVVTGIFLMYRNIVRPIRDLQQATRQVAAGDLEQILPEEGPLEIADLSRSFNTMTAALHASRQKVEGHIQSLKQANEEIARRQEEVVRAARMASVGHLAAGMAHEIGNPLGALIGYLGLLRAELGGREQEIISRSLGEAERIDRLVRDLLDYTAPGRGEVEEIDPAAVLREAAEILTHQGAFAGLTVQDDLPSRLPPVRLQRHKVQQVFVNLLLNARDACTEGKGIRLTGGGGDSDVWLSVADEGKGMDGETLAHIFDPFFTTKDPGKGRGLGLAVCLRIIEEAGGRLEVQSAAGTGSVFTVSLKQAGEEDV